MKRDLDLVTKLLQYFEEREIVNAEKNVDISGYDKRLVHYHLRRMFEAGLIDAEVVYSSTTPTRIIDVFPFGLTWEGHEFLDAIKNDTVVNKAKKKAGGELSNLPFTIVKELLFSILRGELGL